MCNVFTSAISIKVAFVKLNYWVEKVKFNILLKIIIMMAFYHENFLFVLNVIAS